MYNYKHVHVHNWRVCHPPASKCRPPAWTDERPRQWHARAGADAPFVHDNAPSACDDTQARLFRCTDTQARPCSTSGMFAAHAVASSTSADAPSARTDAPSSRQAELIDERAQAVVRTHRQRCARTGSGAHAQAPTRRPPALTHRPPAPTGEHIQAVARTRMRRRAVCPRRHAFAGAWRSCRRRRAVCSHRRVVCLHQCAVRPR